MKNLPNFLVEIDGLKGEVFVSDDHGGKYMCVFVATPVVDFCAVYNAYGFMAWDNYADAKYFPIKLQEQTKLTTAIMRRMWEQINKEMQLRKG